MDTEQLSDHVLPIYLSNRRLGLEDKDSITADAPPSCHSSVLSKINFKKSKNYRCLSLFKIPVLHSTLLQHNANAVYKPVKFLPHISPAAEVLSPGTLLGQTPEQ